LKIFWSIRARKELHAIQTYIARDSRFYASQVAGRIIARVETAAKSPTSGHPVHEYPEVPLREVHQDSYRIIYFASANTLHVVTVVHFKQQLDG
jgi:plasmid stabilization system protein ParE